MLQTYRAILSKGQVKWKDEGPPDEPPLDVHVTVLSVVRDNRGAYGEAMAAALKQIADVGGFAGIDDPVEWQRELRREKLEFPLNNN